MRRPLLVLGGVALLAALMALLDADADSRPFRRTGRSMRSSSSGSGFIPIDPNADSWYVLYGQSLALGFQGSPALNTSATYPGECLEVNGAGSALIDLVETSVERPASGFCNRMRALRGSGIFGVVTGGAGATDLAGLSDPNTPWTNLIAEIQDAYDLTIAAGRTFRIRGIIMFHGESDTAAENPTYGTELLAFRTALEAEIQSIQGTSEDIPMIVYQGSSYRMGLAEENISLQVLDASNADRTLLQVFGPQYIYPYSSDRLHFTNASYERSGEKVANVFYPQHFQGASAWQPLQPTSIVASSDDVVLTLNVPSSPIVVEDTDLYREPFYGFEVLDPTIRGVTLSTAAVTGANEVTLTLSEAPHEDVLIGYGLDAAFAAAGGAAGAPTTLQSDAPGGNIVDSDATDPNGLVHFMEPIDSGFAAAPTDIADRAIHLGDSNDVITTAHNAAMNATDDYTWLIRMRRDDLTHNQNVWRKVSTAVWYFLTYDVTGVHELSLNIGSVNYRTNLGAAPGYWGTVDEWNTWCIIYERNVRLDIIKDGVLLPRTGVDPPTAAIGTNAFGVELGLSTGGANVSIQQVAMWPGLAISHAQAWEVCRTPVDLTATSFADPLIWYRPTASDSLTTASGIVNHGSCGATCNATGTNLVAGDLEAYP